MKYSKTDKRKEKLFWLGIFVVLLTAFQKARITIGPIPLYFAEGLLAVLLFRIFNKQRLSWPSSSRRILTLAKFFFLCVILGEIRGGIEYNFTFPALFQIARMGLGISLLFVLPRLITTPRQFQLVLKAAVVGMLITGSLSIFASLPPTRSLARFIFSNPVLSPAKDRMLVKKTKLWGEDTAIRGTSLVGPATTTGAILCILWPLGLLAYRRIDSNTKWKLLSLLACIVTPIGALATYSRGAWLGLLLIIGLIGFLGYSGNRRIIILFAVLVIIVVSHVGLESKFLLVHRVEKRTLAAFNDPTASKYEVSRLYSYIAPIWHVVRYPSWLLVGTGSAVGRIKARIPTYETLYARDILPTHSVIGMAYLNYGMPGALSHVLLMLFTFALIFRNMRYAKRTDQEELFTWQALLAVWLGGLLPWWLFGHMPVSTARGAMFFFFIFAIFLTCEQLRLRSHGSS